MAQLCAQVLNTARQVQVAGSALWLTVDRNRSRLWMRRGSISVGLWMWRVPRVIGPGGPVNSGIVLGFAE